MGKAKNIHAIMHFRFVSIHLSWVDILQSTNQMQTHSKTTKKTEKGLVGRKNYHYHFAIAFIAYYSTVLNDFGRIYCTACTFVRGSFHKFIFLRFELLTFASCFQNEIYRESFGCDLIFTIPSCGEYYSNFH